MWRGLTIAAVREILEGITRRTSSSLTLAPDYRLRYSTGRPKDRRSAAAHLSDANGGPIASPDREPDRILTRIEMRRFESGDSANVADVAAASFPLQPSDVQHQVTERWCLETRWQTDAFRRRQSGSAVWAPRPNAQRSIIAGMFGFVGADDGTRNPYSQRSRFFVPPRLSPPSDDVRGLDCPFAIARRL